MNQPFVDIITEAFTEAYNNYYALMYSVVYSRLKDPDQTQDICQEVFLRLYERFKDVKNPRKWLYGTVRLVLLEHFRKKGKTDLNIDDVLDDVGMSFVNGFRDTRIMIQEALDYLEESGDDGGRIIFDLIAVNNFTYKETSKQLGISAHQVRYRYKVIVDRLLQYFRERGINNLEDLL